MDTQEVDRVVLALTAWRENDKGGLDGMQSVINSVMNRCKATGKTPYQVCTQWVQYSSLTGPPNPDMARWPLVNDRNWLLALTLADDALMGVLPDLTDGATNYYAAGLNPPPYWAVRMQKTKVIAGQIFFKEST